MDTSDTPAPPTGPVKRTLANTVASLAVILDLLGSVVAAIESSATQRIKGLMLVRAGALRESAADVRACRRMAPSAQEVKDGLLDGIKLAETTIAQLRTALAPSAAARIARFLAAPVRWMWRPAHHFTYADFYQQSEQVLGGLRASRQWVLATPLRRVTLARVAEEVHPTAQPDPPALAPALAPTSTPTPVPEEVPFVVTRLPSGTIEFGSITREEAEDLAGTTPTRWTTYEAANVSLSYGMTAMISPPPASPNPNSVRQQSGERGVERWPMPNAEAPAPPADPAAEPGIA